MIPEPAFQPNCKMGRWTVQRAFLAGLVLKTASPVGRDDRDEIENQVKLHHGAEASLHQWLEEWTAGPKVVGGIEPQAVWVQRHIAK